MPLTSSGLVKPMSTITVEAAGSADRAGARRQPVGVLADDYFVVTAHPQSLVLSSTCVVDLRHDGAVTGDQPAMVRSTCDSFHATTRSVSVSAGAQNRRSVDGV